MRAVWLADVLRDAGLVVHPYPGWETRGAEAFTPRGVILHHTVTRPITPDLTIDQMLAVTGSSKVPAPLANYSTNRDGSISIIASGTANHGGAGNWKGVSGNRLFFGDEMKNLGTTAEPWPGIQLDSARIAAAALLTHLDRDASWLCGHKEYATPPGRKTDPHSLDMNNERARVAALILNEGDDEMSLVARLMVVEAGAKTWLPEQENIDYWFERADNLDNPEYAAEWRRDFEQMWAREKQKEHLAARQPGPPGKDGIPGKDGAAGKDAASGTVDLTARANAAAAHDRLNRLHTV
jgi:hypothetical protein